MTMTTGPMGGRENADDFARYVDEDNDDDPIGGRGGVVAPERRRGRRMEKKEEEEEDDKGVMSGDDDSGEGKGGKGGMEYNLFFRPLNGMGRWWDSGSIDSGTQQSNS
jgi:hypothetical protein